jgi:hypothetical protein
MYRVIYWDEPIARGAAGRMQIFDPEPSASTFATEMWKVGMRVIVYQEVVP